MITKLIQAALIVFIMSIIAAAIPPTTNAKTIVIPRSQKQELCPVVLEPQQYCSDKDECVKGVAVELPTPTPTAKKRPTPTVTLTEETQTNEENATVEETTVAAISAEAEEIFSMINTHRSALGLPAYQKDEKLCEIARSRAPELNNEIFGDSSIHAGFYARDIPFWITENMAGMGSVAANFQWWLNSTIHRQAIESSAFQYTCGVCTDGTCAQLFTSWQPK
ncbi:MAG: CAP domain-containing protein [Weeksellaceae bacterium]